MWLVDAIWVKSEAAIKGWSKYCRGVSYSQSFLSVKPTQNNQLQQLHSCIGDIKAWVTSFCWTQEKQLRYYFLGPKHLRDLISDVIPLQTSITSASCSTIKDLGEHISRTAYFTFVALQIWGLSFPEMLQLMLLSSLAWSSATAYEQDALIGLSELCSSCSVKPLRRESIFIIMASAPKDHVQRIKMWISPRPRYYHFNSCSFLVPFVFVLLLWLLFHHISSFSCIVKTCRLVFGWSQ